MPSPRRSHWNGHPIRAFTLVEVLAASFVMILAIGSSVIALQSGLRSIDNGRRLTLAAQVMQSQTESIRLMSWTNVQALASTATTVNIDSVFAADTSYAKDFTMTMQSVPVSGREDTMREITLVVNWTGAFGSRHTRTFVTRYCKDGLYDYYYTLAGS
ncbi:MAG: type II secretion system protein [Opitutus sp.]|nr:type II secretion system protein [Opitutus sp.]MCS6248656.1 type II secretion system protein [Opitutus sp.]MCS6275482.1 type II secretion system protein [Opitutus sp.]MCS6276569.1 type II secretion system protein [Opitutus sp.]MCS6301782.1 type II secretion system protein [Opitutus sp.]